jgi:predicted DNA-binding protein (UPF0251 family)
MTPLAFRAGKAGAAVGVSRTRIFRAIRDKELKALKDGRATIIETPELQRWLQSLPVLGDESESTAA